MKVPNFRWSSFLILYWQRSHSPVSHWLTLFILTPTCRNPAHFICWQSQSQRRENNDKQTGDEPCYEFADRLIQQYEERNKDYKTELQIWNTRQKALAANLRKVVNRGYPGNRKKRRCVITKEINRHVRFDRILSMKMFRLKRLWKGSMNILRQGYF